MTQFKKFAVKRLHNNELLGFLLRALSSSEALLSSENDKAMLEAFRKAVLDYDVAIQQNSFKHETKAVVDASNRAILVYRGFTHFINGMMNHPQAGKGKIAVKVKDIIEKYDHLANATVNNRYAILYSILQDVNELSSEDQTSLHLSEWIEGLTVAMAEFKIALDVQNTVRGRYQKGLVQDTRLAVEEAYHVFTETLYACFILKEDPCYGALIDDLNAMISVLQTTLKLRATRSENNKLKEETEGSVDNTTPETEVEPAA